jgi:spermidine synthase
VVPLFSATLLLSAALVFLIQPMFAKFVLPLYGSTPAVWNTSLVFFQTALLLAYLYAHATTSRLGVRRQALLHLVLVLAPLVVLPIAVPDDFRPPAEGDQVLSLLGLLAVAVGLPFFVVSATAPLLQRWLAATDHPAGTDPYFLYRASNLGSVIGLLGYPLALEPALRLEAQGWVWSAAYAALVVLLVACAVVTWRSRPAATLAPPEPVEAPPPLTTRRRLRWVGLAFVPASLMLSVTAFLTIDIAPVPLLWAIPLSLYLASFIAAFSTTARAERLHRATLFALPGVAILLLILLLVDAREPLWLVMPLHLAGFFVLALACHGELARDRPPASSLTGFYLLVAVGGALGGLLTGIVVPAVVDSLPEYPLAIVLACLCLPRRTPRIPPGPIARQLDFALPVAIGALVALVLALVSLDSSGDYEGAGKSFAFGLGAGIALNFIRRPLRFTLAVGAIAVAGSLPIGEEEKELLQKRSFFGVHRVTASEDGRLHNLEHGTTTHGAQDLSPERRRTPLTYFHPSGPVGQLMASVPPRTKDRVAIIGLGTGSMACYSAPGDRFTFYELDPTVERIARDPALFTYLRDCRGRFDVVPGDARLSLERAAARGYGMLVADAFSSDAIPTHLLTREALRLYRSKLRDGGVLAFHISNRFLELEPVLGDLARDAGLACFAQKEPHRVRGRPRGKIPSHWVAMSESRSDLGRLASDRRWHRCRLAGSDAWTDDFSRPLAALKLG